MMHLGVPSGLVCFVPSFPFPSPNRPTLKPPHMANHYALPPAVALFPPYVPMQEGRLLMAPQLPSSPTNTCDPCVLGEGGARSEVGVPQRHEQTKQESQHLRSLPLPLLHLALSSFSSSHLSLHSYSPLTRRCMRSTCYGNCWHAHGSQALDASSPGLSEEKESSLAAQRYSCRIG